MPAPDRKRYLVGLPMYNERGVARLVIEDLLAEMAKLSVPHEILVVDDCSTDGTSEILAGFEGIEVLRHERNLGVGATFASMLDACRGRDVTHFVFQEGSYKVRAREIAKLIRVCEESDFDYILGSRFLVNQHNTPLVRRLLIRHFSTLFRLVTGFPVTDISCGPRIVNLARWDHRLDGMREYYGYQFEHIMTIALLHHGASFRPVDVEIQYIEERPYSYVKFYNMSQIIRPWLHYCLWKRLLPVDVVRPRWLLRDAPSAGEQASAPVN